MTGFKMGRSTQQGFNKNSERLIKAQNRLKSQKKEKTDDPERKMLKMEKEIHELMDASALEEVGLYFGMGLTTDSNGSTGTGQTCSNEVPFFGEIPGVTGTRGVHQH
jgi:hypothetical protein